MGEAGFYIDCKRRSTAELQSRLAALKRKPCECDDYHGFKCSKHWRVSMVEHFLESRTPTDP